MKMPCIALLAALLFGSAPYAQDKPGATPPAPATGVVKGITLRIMQGRPPLPPPSPVGAIEVYFKSGENIFQTTSGEDGAYSIELPPGAYRIGWRAGHEQAKDADPFDHSRSRRPLGPETTEIRVEAGQTYERDLPVLVMEIY